MNKKYKAAKLIRSIGYILYKNSASTSDDKLNSYEYKDNKLGCSIIGYYVRYVSESNHKVISNQYLISK